MSTDNHTLITDYAPVNASTFNSPLGELDAAIGDLSSLPTTEKGSLVGSINEIRKNITKNEHINATDQYEYVSLGYPYVQIDSSSVPVIDLSLPSIALFGLGNVLTVMITSAIVSSGTWVNLVPNAVAGDAVIGGDTIVPSSQGCFKFRTVSSYPGETGACWVRMTEGGSLA